MRNPSHNIQWQRAATLILQGVLLLGLLAFYALVIATQAALPAGADYTKFYFAAYQALHGQPIYAVMDAAIFGADASQFFQSALVADPPLHMPQVTAAYAPLALLPFAPSFWLYSALSLAAGLVACAILWRELYGPRASRRTLLWIWIALLAFFPTFTALRLGQGSLFFFLLATLTWWAARRGHTRRAGLALGLAFSLRTFGGLLLFYFLLQRRWKLLLWSGISFAATILASLPLVGVDAYRDWLSIAAGLDIQGRNWNGSLAGFFARLLPPAPALLLTAAGVLAWLALLTWTTWPRAYPQASAQASQERDDLTYSLALGLMLLLSPLGWMYYFPIQWVGALVIWRQTAARRHALRWALLPSWLLSNTPTNQYPVTELTSPLGWWTWNSVYFYALLIFCSLLAFMVLKNERVMASPTHPLTRSLTGSHQTPPSP